VQDNVVQARYAEQGEWQKFIIENNGGGPIVTGETVYFKAHTGKFVDVEGTAVSARYTEQGGWQSFSLEKACDETVSGDKGSGYRGCQDKTRTDKSCLNWWASYADPAKGISEDHAYCRNPGGYHSSIWCFTSWSWDWAYCDPKAPTTEAPTTEAPTTGAVREAPTTEATTTEPVRRLLLTSARP